MRIGYGYDIHRLASGRPLVLGGVNIPFSRGPEGHSDGDALIHALCDAILGALGKGDIGVLFPDTDPGYKDMDSKTFLRGVNDICRKEGYEVGNIDSVIVLEEPKIFKYRQEITRTLAEILGISDTCVSVKGKTAEGLGSVGEGKAVEAQVVVLLKEKG